MDFVRSMLGGVAEAAAGSSGSSGAAVAAAAETIELLVNRLTHSTLLDDRRDACRALKAMSRKFRIEVGAQALEHILEVLETEATAPAADEEILSYALDTLCNICSPEEFEEEVISDNARDNINNIGEQFTEIFLKRAMNVQTCIDILDLYDFKVRRPAVKLLTNLLLNKPRDMQEYILGSRMGVSRLMDILVDPREVLRNDALLLLIQLTKGNANLQKIVAFENAFDKLVDIIQSEEYSDGGIVVEDCLRLMLNLLRNNPSNQTFFREGSYIQKAAKFFDLTLDEQEIEIGWSAQKVSNMLHMLLVMRTLVSPSNPTGVTSSCQDSILNCGLLEKLCSILMAAGIPAEILTETINAISECIRGHLANQNFFSSINAPTVPPKSALMLLLMSMVNEKQPFSLRCAVLYCFQSYLHKNPAGQHNIMLTLLPSSDADPVAAPPAAQLPTSPATTKVKLSPASRTVKPSGDLATAKTDLSAGQLLCGGLFSPDRLSNWFSATALAHGLTDHDNIKLELLRVQLSTAGGNVPVSFLAQVCNIVQMTSNIQSRIGYLMLICTWINNCPSAVSHLLRVDSMIPFLTGQIGSNEHDELERLGQGICAFLLGLGLVFNDDSVAGSTQDQLYQLIEKRIGYEVFMDKLSEVTKHEAHNRALKHPQIKCHEASELVFDHKFCSQFKHLEHVVINWLAKRKENSEDGAEVVSIQDVEQYKELIREQDKRITDLSHANIYLQQALVSAKQQVEEQESSIQTLRDQNQLLKASNKAPVAPAAVTNGGTELPGGAMEEHQVISNEEKDKLREAEETRRKLEKEVRLRDEIIMELEMRLQSGTVGAGTNATSQTTEGAGVEEKQQQIEGEMLQTQIHALYATVAAKDAEIDRLNGLVYEFRSMKGDFEVLRTEQDDLLMMLSDQDTKIDGYKKKLKALGETLDGDDDDDTGGD